MASTSIFISYRREDSVGHAGRLFDRLVERFGRQHVFRDIDAIEAGENFVDAVRQKIHASDVLLALIGPRWLTAADTEGRWRLADEQDLVRVEIATALARNLRVIPVLVQGAPMPRAKDLPGELAGLAQRNAVQIRDTHFDQDVEQLTDILGPAWRHRLGRMILRWPVYVAASLVLAVLLGVWIYPHVALTPERARMQIGQMGLTYDTKTFVERATDNDEQAVVLFLRAGMAPDALGAGGSTALGQALRNRNLVLAQTLLDKGADVNPALGRAAYEGNREAIGFLLGRAPSPTGLNQGLRDAATSGHTDIVQTMLDKGADVNAKNKDGETALMRAAEAAHVGPVQLLLSRGADVRSTTPSGITALHAVLNHPQRESERSEIVRALLAKGALVNERVKLRDGWQPTPLLLAIDLRHSELARLLIDHGADVNFQTREDRSGRTVTTLMLAARNGLDATIAVLLGKGLDANVRNDRGETALMFAVEGETQGQTKTVQLLLAAGADANVRDKGGRTALMLAAWSRLGNDAVQPLIAGGAQINAVDKDGWTALMYAAQHGLPETVDTLMRHGADRDVRSHKGQTALMIAQTEGRKDTAQTLAGEPIAAKP